MSYLSGNADVCVVSVHSWYGFTQAVRQVINVYQEKKWAN